MKNKKTAELTYGLVVYVEVSNKKLFDQLCESLPSFASGNEQLCVSWDSVEDAIDDCDNPSTLCSFLDHVCRRIQEDTVSGIGDVIFWCSQ